MRKQISETELKELQSKYQVEIFEDDEVEKLARVNSVKELNFPYSDFQGKDKNGVDGEHTGQALRGAYCGGFEEGFKQAKEMYGYSLEQIKSIIINGFVMSTDREFMWKKFEEQLKYRNQPKYFIEVREMIYEDFGSGHSESKLKYGEGVKTSKFEPIIENNTVTVYKQ